MPVSAVMNTSLSDSKSYSTKAFADALGVQDMLAQNPFRLTISITLENFEENFVAVYCLENL